MKPFNIKEAKAGKSVCTREGKPARIICWDRKDDTYPIIALITEDGHEDTISLTIEGKYYSDGENGCYDLMMVSEKKEGWVNVYYDNDASSHRGCRFIYDTKERAVKEAGSAHIATVKIEWEE